MKGNSEKEIVRAPINVATLIYLWIFPDFNYRRLITTSYLTNYAIQVISRGVLFFVFCFPAGRIEGYCLSIVFST